MSVQGISDDTTFTMVSPSGQKFLLLRLSVQVSAEAMGPDMLALAEAQRLAVKGESDLNDPQVMQSFVRTAKKHLAAAMISPRLADDDLALDVDGDAIGWKRIGDYALTLFRGLMESQGDPSVFRLSPPVQAGTL